MEQSLCLSGLKNKHVVGMIKSVKYYEKLTVEAALSGDDDTALGGVAC